MQWLNKSQISENIVDRLSWLDILKGIGIILVLIGHIYSNNTVFNWIYSFHMPLFFLAAGFTYKKKPILQDIKHRFQTIVIPYFSFGLLDLLYWAVLERRFRESDMGVLESFIGLFSGEYQYLDFNVHLWFLPCFFMTVVLFNILVNAGMQIERRKKQIEQRKPAEISRGRRFENYAGKIANPKMISILTGKVEDDTCKNTKKLHENDNAVPSAHKFSDTQGGYCRLTYLVSAVMSFVFMLSDILGNPLPDLPWGVDRIFKYIGFYAVGYFLHEHHVDSNIREKSRAGMAAISVVLLLANFGLAYAGLTTGLMWFVTALIGVAAVGIAAVLINRNRMLQYFGRISLVVLCVHGPVYRVIIKLVSVPARMSTDAVRENLILAMLVAVLTLLVCAAVQGTVIRAVPWLVGKPKNNANNPTREAR